MRDRADLVMRFIALSMPAGFTYEPVVVPSLNGLLRADIGYGLFGGHRAKTKTRPATEGGRRRIRGRPTRRGCRLCHAPHRLAPTGGRRACGRTSRLGRPNRRLAMGGHWICLSGRDRHDGHCGHCGLCGVSDARCRQHSLALAPDARGDAARHGYRRMRGRSQCDRRGLVASTLRLDLEWAAFPHMGLPVAVALCHRAVLLDSAGGLVP